MTTEREVQIELFLHEYRGLAIVQAVSHPIMGLFLEQFLIYLEKIDALKEGALPND